MLKSLGKFFGACVMGDPGAALEALSEAPEAEAPKVHVEGDPPCGKADGETRCTGHGPGGTCVMGEVH